MTATVLTACRFFAGYSITSRKEISEYMPRRMSMAGASLYLSDHLSDVFTEQEMLDTIEEKTGKRPELLEMNRLALKKERSAWWFRNDEGAPSPVPPRKVLQ